MVMVLKYYVGAGTVPGVGNPTGNTPAAIQSSVRVNIQYALTDSPRPLARVRRISASETDILSVIMVIPGFISSPSHYSVIVDILLA
jgi:hypothetical protein